MNVLIIDDDRLVCSSLQIILDSDPDITVIGIGHNGEEAIALYEEFQPDILLMDIRMGEMSGLEAGEIILEKNSHGKILFLTTFLDDEYIIKALNIGAKGYMLKQEYNCIIPAIKAIYSGHNVYGDEIVTKLPHLITNTDNNTTPLINTVTEKENTIIHLIAEGLSNKEIADSLFLSEGTVRNYISTILEKLHLRDRTQIAIYFYKWGRG